MGYLCGNSENCEDATDIATRETAIDNIDNKFAVVGDSDNYEVTLAVLEHKLPRYFNGALKVKQNFFYYSAFDNNIVLASGVPDNEEGRCRC